MLVDGELKIKALLHRDGDFLNIDEAAKWRESFKTPGVFPWVTAGSDIEAYFCQTSYLTKLYGASAEEVETWRQDAAKKISGAHETFLEKRRKVVSALWRNGGSPDAEAMWADAGGISPITVKGKRFLAALKPVIKATGRDSGLLNAFTIPSGFTVAPELKILIQEAVPSDPSP